MMNTNNALIFLVDDDPIFQKVLETQFKERTSYQIKTFSTGEECLKNLSQQPDIIFLDYNLSASDPKAGSGLHILEKVKKTDPKIQVVMLSSQDKIEVAVNCLKHDAFDYLVKSESAFIRAQKTIAQLFKQRKLEKELVFYRASAIGLFILVGIAIIIAAVMQVYHPELMK